MSVKRPRDGMYTKFTGATMNELVTLVPDFAEPKLATAFLREITSRARFKKYAQANLLSGLPHTVRFSSSAYRCVDEPQWGGEEIGLTPDRRNPMEVLHRLTHYVQSLDSPWHGGEFGSIFLDLVDRAFGKDVRRDAKAVLVKNKIKTTTMSPEARKRASDNYLRRRHPQVKEKLLKMQEELRELRELVEEEDA